MTKEEIASVEAEPCTCARCDWCNGRGYVLEDGDGGWSGFETEPCDQCNNGIVETCDRCQLLMDEDQTC